MQRILASRGIIKDTAMYDKVIILSFASSNPRAVFAIKTDVWSILLLMKINRQMHRNLDLAFYYKKVKTIQNIFHSIYTGIYLSTLTQVRIILFVQRLYF